MKFPKVDMKDPNIAKLTPSEINHVRRNDINAFIKKVCETCSVDQNYMGSHLFTIDEMESSSLWKLIMEPLIHNSDDFHEF